MSDKSTRLYVSTENEVGQLIKRVEALEGEVAALHVRCTKIVDHICDKTHPRIGELYGMCSDIFQRLKQVELRVFPNLAADIRRIHQIVPPNDEIFNDDLDIRQPPSGKEGEKEIK